MAERRVTIDEALLNVVGVSIKAVQIGKKQMTLSVFRQLEHEAIWDCEMACPKGIVWGRVNYFWDGCRRNPSSHPFAVMSKCDRMHILWQNGAELRRSYLYEDIGEAENDYPFFYPDDQDLRIALNYRGLTCAPERPSEENTCAWERFFDKHIALSEQLFIAV